ncbi:hypothetical protein RISK_006404 [Rhodopirellula islandica]|uniref:Uncharacterized protein n=1 Tax=Rhodopirellula islandica TaxID=595434 RepID=A0A0J1B476_RHOIS|nr:hypothetical protein RISK_006404 [Rhodopirellula islandica]
MAVHSLPSIRGVSITSNGFVSLNHPSDPNGSFTDDRRQQV